jgi:hypothetical protein
MEEVAEESEQSESSAAGNGNVVESPLFEPGHDLDNLRHQLEQGLLIVHGTGVHLKSIEHGILDFPTFMSGHEVYLCWQLGEERVTCWHPLEAGFAGRRQL